MDVIDGCVPFVLNMTLECSPEDTESLLGFKPQNGANYYGLYDFPDKSCYYNNKWSTERLERVYNILKEMVSNEKMIKPAEVVNEQLDEFIN